MKCNDCREQLSAYLDQELEADVIERVRHHLEGCQECARELSDLQQVDARLRGLRLPPASFVKSPTSKSSTASISNGFGSRKIVTVIAVLAATVVIAFGIWRISTSISSKPDPQPIAKDSDKQIDEKQIDAPEKSTELDKADARRMAMLTRATGDVEVKRKDSSQWVKLVGVQNNFEEGDRIRTPSSVTCELETRSNSKLRLNQDSEVTIRNGNRIECRSGQVWCRTGLEEMEFDIDSSTAKSGETINVRCSTSSEVQWSITDSSASCAAIGDEKASLVFANSFNCPVEPGAVAILNDQGLDSLQPPSGIIRFTAKVWQLPLLAIGESHDPELDDLVESTLAYVGEAKVTHFVESQVRALGPAGSTPLFAYVENERSKGNPDRREKAMRLACDLTDVRNLERLARLGQDPDSSISDLATSTLRRLQTQ